jgi:hypothetical protein
MALAALTDLDVPSLPGPGRRTVLVAVGTVDRRAVEATRFAMGIPATEHHAVHVGPFDDVAHAWCERFPDGLPLDLLDGHDVATTIAAHARRILERGADEVFVVVGRLAGQGVRRRLLHDRTADAVVAAVDAVPGAAAVVVPVSAGTWRPRRSGSTGLTGATGTAGRGPGPAAPRG